MNQSKASGNQNRQSADLGEAKVNDTSASKSPKRSKETAKGAKAGKGGGKKQAQKH